MTEKLGIKQLAAWGCGAGLVCTLLVVGIYVSLQDSQPFVSTYAPLLESPDGRFLAARVLVSNGRRKDRTIAVCNQAPTEADRKWVYPFKWEQIRVVQMRWSGPSVLTVDCHDLTDGCLKPTYGLDDPPVTVHLVFQ